MTNNRILILALLITGTYTLSAQEVLRLYCPHPELNEDSCGYINSRKEPVIPVGKYQRIYSLFFDKIAFVSLKGKKGFMLSIVLKKFYLKFLI